MTNTSVIGLCATCRHWESYGEDGYRDTGDCGLTKIDWATGRAAFTGSGKAWIDRYHTLTTMADFGCVQYEAKG